MVRPMRTILLRNRTSRGQGPADPRTGAGTALALSKCNGQISAGRRDSGQAREGYGHAWDAQARVHSGGDCCIDPAMTDDGRTITAKVPQALAAHLDEIALRIDRSRSWIVRQALAEWLAEEQRRYELTLEALDDVDAGRVIPHETLLARSR